ncbi:sodium-dependent bicarbonate transport family permease [Mycolicibacter sinensis]|uniref:Sodium-dependent bicarbonate transport family permease n=1 Tax=Mycolicibacter sinensis (strain JDM601) TaxID=875328 RepID=A0A1A2ET85_MYCSD|nr:sodium-dependent bicarbonate transport family permease [Mycolicibacter sinensis]OBG03307.1 sodium-dependent bicarbonate transport family permease [Mycolicibacter sinensis]OBG07729.1 sodium-dependent bicarbonate transport family permease [Mycolicibacter sinensis]
MLLEFWHNFSHNLFKPLLLFFYLGFLMPILKVPFEFPPAIYHGLTMYLLLAIGWHGGEELAGISMSSIGGVLGFMATGFLLNFVIGALAYFILKHTTRMREVDRATVAGYYGSDSAGTFATCVGVLATADIVFDSYMPVMLAIMEIPGCLVALLLVARLRRRGMDSTGLLPGEIGYIGSGASVVRVAQGSSTETVSLVALEDFPEDLEAESGKAAALDAEPSFISGAILREVFLNPGLCLLMGGIAIGFISGLQGQKVTAVDDPVFLTAFQGALCLFLLEMGMTASRKLRDLRAAGRGFILFGLLAPNLFATIGIMVAHLYSQLTGFPLETGTYVLFAVLCGAASYIAVPAIQRLAIPEASPSLPLAASLGLTFSYNVTIGIPLYIELAHILARM